MQEVFPESRAARSFPAGERDGEQAEAEAVEPWRADAGGNQSASRETPDRTRCTRCGRQSVSGGLPALRRDLPPVQPPDTENRTSGGVGGCRGAIPGTRPDRRASPTGQKYRLGVCPTERILAIPAARYCTSSLALVYIEYRKVFVGQTPSPHFSSIPGNGVGGGAGCDFMVFGRHRLSVGPP